MGILDLVEGALAVASAADDVHTVGDLLREVFRPRGGEAGSSKAIRRRMFLALVPDERTRKVLGAEQQLLRPSVGKASWTPLANLHVTLAFLGQVDEDETRAAAEVARRVAAGAAGAFDVTVKGLGRFEKRGGDVLYAQVTQTPELMGLQASLAEALRREGLELEERPYAPHVTLARGMRVSDSDAFERGCELAGGGEVGFRAERVSLMWSHHPKDRGLVYDEVASWGLGDGASDESASEGTEA